MRHYFPAIIGPTSSAPIWGGGIDLAGVWSLNPDNKDDCEPLAPKTWKFRTAAHVRYEFVKGLSGDVPFVEMVVLGGDNLRGFGKSRFFDLCGFLFAVEQRLTIWDVMLFGVKGQLEIAPFLDTGKVFSDTGEELLLRADRNYQFTYGVAFRGVVPPFVVGRVEIGYGQDGLNIFVGLNYPY